MPLRYWALILLLAAGWGASFFFNEILLRELGPLTVGLGRVGFGAMGCWIWIVLSRTDVTVPRHMWGALVLFGLIQYAVPLSVYPFTQQFITSSAAGIVNATTPIMVVIVSHLWPGGEKATWAKSIGVALGFVGLVVLVSPAFAGQGASEPVALIATMTAPLCYGIAMNLLRRFEGLDRTVLTAWSLLFGTAFLIPVALGAEGMPTVTRIETWASLFVIGFVLTSAAFVLVFWLIPRVGGTVASTITLLAPISAVLLGALVLGEEVALVQLAGMAIILSGVLFIDGRVLKLFRHRQPIG